MITKPDLVDIGAEREVVKVVLNKVKKLNLGYVLVKNRGQKMLEEGSSIAAAREEEQRYFAEHKEYSNIPKELTGVDSLTAKLTSILVSRIIDLLPSLQKDASERLSHIKEEIMQLGKKPPTTPAEERTKIFQAVHGFTKLLRDSIRGTYVEFPFIEDEGTRVQAVTYIRLTEFQKEIEASRPDFGSPEYMDAIKLTISKSRGLELPGFLSTTIFNGFVVRYLNTWETCALTCCKAIVEEYKVVIGKLCDYHLHFYRMKNAFHKCTSISVDELSKGLLEKVADAAREEKLIPSTLNHYFMDTVNKMILDENM